MEPHTAQPEEAWRLGRGPFIFHGVPPMCVGDLDLVNESDEKVKVRTIAVVGHQDEAISNLGLSELKVRARLGPRVRTRARAFFVLDPLTPPGTYRAHLSCGGQQEPVVVHVWKKLALRLNPRVIQVRGGAGDVLKAVVVITNNGNVVETFCDLALVYLEERTWLGRTLVSALREADAEEGHQAYLDHVARELKLTMPRPAHVTVRAEVSELQPGETREAEVQITLPVELRKGRTYVGRAKYMSSSMIFNVECNGASNSTKRRPQ